MSRPDRIGASHRRPATQAAEDAGAQANRKLTASTGAVLLLGFAIEGCTLLALHRLLVVHFLVGLLLIGPALLKVASTGYRFARYYTRAPGYVRRGPPPPVLRVLGPLVIATSAAVLGTGVALALAGPGQGDWLLLHKLSFIAWFAVMTVHVLNYAPRLPRILAAREDRSGDRVTMLFSGPARWLTLAAALVAGVAVAVVTMRFSGAWGISP